MFDFEPLTGFLQQCFYKKRIAGIIFDQKDAKPVFGHMARPIHFRISGLAARIRLILHIFASASNPAHQSANAPEPAL
jgi:hypothetical protein